MRRTQSTRTLILEIINSIAKPRVRQAYLLDNYEGFAREVLIQFSNPNRTRGATVKALIKPGLNFPSIASGTPVSVMVNRGHYEVIGLSGPGVI